MSALEITLRDHEYWLSIKGERYATEIFIDVDNSMVVDLMVLHALSEAVSSTAENLASLRTRIVELEAELDEYKALEAIKAIEAPIDDELNKEADDEHAKLVKLADEYFEYRRKHEWRPINSAPKDKKVLLRLHNGHIESGYWIEIFNMWSTEDLQPTLWMPLPEEI